MPRNKKPSDDDNLEFPLDAPADESTTEATNADDSAETSEPQLETEAEATEQEDIFETKPVSGHVDDMFSEWFLDYASYVIL